MGSNSYNARSSHKFRLPDSLGGGVIEATEFYSGCAGARPEYHLPDGATLLMPHGEILTPVAPPPPKPGMYQAGNEYVFVNNDPDGAHALVIQGSGSAHWYHSDWVAWPIAWGMLKSHGNTDLVSISLYDAQV